MHEFPRDRRKIIERIRRYERAFKQEAQAAGMISDGYGKRYLLGALYLLAGDVDGALDSFEWYEREFPDDCGDPMQYLCWTLVLYRIGDEKSARKKLSQTMLQNLYLIPYLLGEAPEELDIWHGCNLAEPGYLSWIPPEIFDLWDEQSLGWVRRVCGGEGFKNLRERFIEIRGELKQEPVGPRRTKLVEESCRLEREGVAAIRDSKPRSAYPRE